MGALLFATTGSLFGPIATTFSVFAAAVSYVAVSATVSGTANTLGLTEEGKRDKYIESERQRHYKAYEKFVESQKPYLSEDTYNNLAGFNPYARENFYIWPKEHLYESMKREENNTVY